MVVGCDDRSEAELEVDGAGLALIKGCVQIFGGPLVEGSFPHGQALTLVVRETRSESSQRRRCHQVDTRASSDVSPPDPCLDWTEMRFG